MTGVQVKHDRRAGEAEPLVISTTLQNVTFSSVEIVVLRSCYGW